MGCQRFACTLHAPSVCRCMHSACGCQRVADERTSIARRMPSPPLPPAPPPPRRLRPPPRRRSPRTRWMRCRPPRWCVFHKATRCSSWPVWTVSARNLWAAPCCRPSFQGSVHLEAHLFWRIQLHIIPEKRAFPPDHPNISIRRSWTRGSGCTATRRRPSSGRSASRACGTARTCPTAPPRSTSRASTQRYDNDSMPTISRCCR